MLNISGFGLEARLVASSTFPTGITLTAFSDDGDALDTPDFQVADTGFGLNGDMVVWAKPGGIEAGFSIIPTSQDDVNLDVLMEANRVGKGKRGARDIVDIVVSYPNGTIVTFSSGIMVLGALTPGVQQQGRFKTRVYRFRFEKITKVNAVTPVQ